MKRLTFHRRSIRLRGYDYRRCGMYFVTICTHKRECLFGEVKNGVMELSESGKTARTCWLDIPTHFQNVQLDEFVVMPNHIHGVIIIEKQSTPVGYRGMACRTDATVDQPLPIHTQCRGMACHAPTHDRGGRMFGKPQSDSLSSIIGSFKSATAKRVNLFRDSPGAPVWQRNFHEHIIRDNDALERIRRYILNNPRNWPSDSKNVL